jgi:toxin ParE1/3/4
MKVVWTSAAIADTKTIYQYYKSNVSINVAKSIKLSIFSSVKTLHKNPNQGQVEELLRHREDTYRYIVSSNYKIIYKVSEINIIYIMKVFDCRRNPELIKND